MFDEARALWLWASLRIAAMREDDERERGDGILIWVIMTAALAVAAIAIVAIIVTKARDTANNTNTQ
jgi:heme/copper-type cytochrome/quinol oxidase subunit 2